MALNNDKNKDIFGLSSLVPPTTNDEGKKDEEKIESIKSNTNQKSIVNKQSKVGKASSVNTKSTDSKVSKPSINKSEKLFTARARFYDEDDKAFLKYYGGNLGFTQEEFINYILENEINSTKKIDVKDDEHESFRKNNLLFYSTIRLPEKNKKNLLKAAANHRLSQEQFLGYIVRKERFNTPGWY